MSEDYIKISAKFVQLTSKLTALSNSLSKPSHTKSSSDFSSDWLRNLSMSHESFIAELNRLIIALQAEDYVRPHINDILHMYSTENGQLQNLLSGYDKAIQRLERDTTRKLKKLEDESKSVFNELEETFFKQKDLNNQLSLKLQKYKSYKQKSIKVLAAKENEISEQKKEKAFLNQTLKTTEFNLEILQKDVDIIRQTKESEIYHIKQKNEKLELEMLIMQKKHLENKLAIKDKYRKTIEEINNKHETRVEDLEKNHARELFKFSNRMNETISELDIAHESKVMELNVQIKAIENEKIKLNQDWSILLKTREEAWSGKYHLLKEIYEKRLQELQAKHDSELTETVEKLKLEHYLFKERIETQKELEITNLKDEHAKKIQDMESHYDTTYNSCHKNWSDILKQKSADYERVIAEKDHYLARETKLKEDSVLRFEDYVRKTETDRKLLVKELDKCNTDYELEKELRIQQDVNVQTLTHQLQIKEVRIVALNKDIEIEKENIVKEFKDKFERKMFEIKIQHQNQVEIMNSNQDIEEDKYQEAIKTLDKKYENLLKLFNNRPSRSEDLKKIRKLHDELIYKERALRQAFEDVKLLRLELVNREETYNKYFRQSRSGPELHSSASQRLPRTSSPFSARLIIRPHTPTKFV